MSNLIPLQLDLNTGNIVAAAVSGVGGGGGTVTSIAATGSIGLVVGGSPISTNGTLTFTLSTELQALSALAATGFVQRTGVGTYVVSNLTSSQITTALAYTPQVGPLTGDVTTPSAISGVTTLATINANTGTFGDATHVPAFNVNAKGLITAVASAAIAFPVTSVTGSGAGISVAPTVGNVVVSNTGVVSFNARTGAVTLLSSDVTNALGYTPATGSVTSVAVTANNGISATVNNPSTTPSIILGLGAITPASVNASGTLAGSNFSGSSSGTNTGDQVITLTGDVTGSGTSSFASTLANTAVVPGTYTLATVTVDSKGRVTSASNGAGGGGGTVTSVGITSGDLTVTSSPVTTSGNIGLTLASVNGNVGTFGNGTTVPVITVNAKGLVTAASTNAIVYPVSSVFGRTGTVVLLSSDVLGVVPNVSSFTNDAGYITGVTLTSSNLTITGSGTATLTANLPASGVTAGSYTNTNVTVDAFGRVTAASNGSSGSLPLTTKGDLLGYDTAPNRVPVGLDGQLLTADSTQALGVRWSTVATGSGTVTSVGATSTAGDLAITATNGNPITTFGAFDYELATQGGLVPAAGYNNFTVNAKGIVTAASTVAYLTSAPVTSVFGRIGAVVATTNDYSFAQISGSATAAQLPALVATGDATGTGTAGTATIPLTLATVNGNVGTFGDGTDIPVITVNAKGLITAVTTTPITAAGVSSFNTRTGAVTLTSGDVTTALGFTPGQGSVTSVSVTTANGVSGSVATPTTTPAITLTLGAITPTSVAATGNVSGANLSGTNTGDQTITLTGDVTGSGTGSFAATLATVNGNVGSFGDSTHVMSQTVNAKGLTTAAANVAITFPVTSVFGRTGAVVAATNDYSFAQLSGSAAFVQIPALTFSGDATGTYVPGTGNTALTLSTSGVTAGTYTNATVTVDAKGRVTSASSGAGGSGTVTSVAFADTSTTPIYSITGSPVTTTGTLTQTLTTQTANAVFAGPAVGAAAQPTFRALVAKDIPTNGIERVVWKYTAGTTNTFNSSTPVSVTSGVAVSGVVAATSTADYSFTGYDHPPVSIAVYGQQTNAPTVGATQWSGVLLPTPQFVMADTGTNAAPNLLTSFTSSNTIKGFQTDGSVSGATDAASTGAYLIIEFKF